MTTKIFLIGIDRSPLNPNTVLLRKQIYPFNFQSIGIINYLITVSVRLERTFNWDSDVIGLFLAKKSELGTKGRKVELGNLLVEVLGKNVDLSSGVLSRVLLLVQFELGQDLVGERARHNERRVTGGTSQVKKTSLGEDDNTVVVLEDELVDLGLDVNALGGLHETVHVNFVIEVTNVSNNGVVLHLGHVVLHEDSLVTSGGDENISGGKNFLKSGDGVTFHAGLEGADGVNFGDVDDTSVGTHGVGTSLTDISVSADDGLLSGKHDISGTHNTIGKRVLASVQVVEFGLGDRVVDVDGREKKGSVLFHGVQSVDTGGGLLGNSVASGGHLVPLVGFTGFQKTLDDGQDNLEFSVVGTGRIREGSVLEEEVLGLLTLVDKKGHVTTIIDDEIRSVSLAIILVPGEGVQGALPVFLEGLSLPGENSGGFIAGDGSGGVILGREDVARAPSDITSKLLGGLNENSSLDGHVKGTGNTSSGERFGRSVFGTARHKTRHLNLSEFDILATVVGKGNIGNCKIRRIQNKAFQKIRLVGIHSDKLASATSITPRTYFAPWFWLVLGRNSYLCNLQ